MECFQHYFALGVSVMRMESGTSPAVNGLPIRASSERSVNFSSSQPVNAASTLYTPGFKPPKSLSIQKKRPVNCFLMELHQGSNHKAKSCVA